jgi:hypothetical protein
LYLLYRTLKVAVKKFRLAEDPLNAAIGMGLFGAAIALSVAGVFEYNFGTTQVRLAQWFLFGLL